MEQKGKQRERAHGHRQCGDVWGWTWKRVWGVNGNVNNKRKNKVNNNKKKKEIALTMAGACAEFKTS